MLIIHPVTAETIQLHIGLPVAVVTHEGYRYFGILSGVVQNQVILNDQPSASTSTTKGRKGKKVKISQRRIPKKRARTRQHQPGQAEQPPQAYPIHPDFEASAVQGGAHPFSERIAIDLSAVAYIVAMV
jgi:hypothetical protein